MSSDRRSTRLQRHDRMGFPGRHRNCSHAADTATRLNVLSHVAHQLARVLDSQLEMPFVRDGGRGCSFQRPPLYHRLPFSKSHSHTWALRVERHHSYPSWSHQTGHTVVLGDCRLVVKVELGNPCMVKAETFVVEDRPHTLLTGRDDLEVMGSMHYNMRICRSNIQGRNTDIELRKKRRIERSRRQQRSL